MVALNEKAPSSAEVEAKDKRRKRKRPKKNVPSTGATEESEHGNTASGEEGDAEGKVSEEKVREDEKMKKKKRKTKTKTKTKGELEEGHENDNNDEGAHDAEGEVEEDEAKGNGKKKVKTGGSGIMSTVSFDSLELSEKTLRAIKDMGFEHMTQVRFLLELFDAIYQCSFLV